MSNADKHTQLGDEFAGALENHASRFGVQLNADTVTRLREYYEQVMAWNARLHLVAPCRPEEFATRHVLESSLALAYLTRGAHFIDVGSGAGLPAIPCLIVRPDLRATLVEASTRKAVFLREALRTAGVHERAQVIAERFEKTLAPAADFVTCRALDRFTELFPQLVQWSPPACTLLLFGGDSLREEIEKLNLNYTPVRAPLSARRFLFVIEKESTV